MTARSLTRIVYPVTGLLLIVVAWALACWLGRLPVVVLPSPDKVLYAFAGNMRLLLEESWVTLKETLYGFGLALALGLPMAVAVATSRTLNLMFYPLLIALQSVPKVALAPIILVWLGPDLQSKLAIAWLVAFFPIIVDTAAGLRATPKELLELAHSLKATRSQILFKVQFPAAVPCVMLGAGRTPVHQALQRLELERLVEIMPRKGVIVQPDSIAEILKILDSRVTVEADLARNAAQQRTAEDAEVLKLLARRGYGNGQPADVDTFITGDRTFHEQFAKMAGNVVLSEFARSLHERSIRYWYLHLWQTMDTKATIRQHSAIADMIAKGDGEGAAKAVRDHIESLRERLMKAQSATRRIPPPR